MSKKGLILQGENPVIDRGATEAFYVSKYFNYFMNKFKFAELGYQENDYIFRKLWAVGSLACFPYMDTLVFTTYGTGSINIYDFPVLVNLINTRGVSFIPNTPQEVDKDVVLLWAQRNHKSVQQLVNYYVKKIVNVEMVININLQVSKTPWLVAVTPETREKMRALYNLIYSDNPQLFIDLEDADKVKALTSGSTYIIDKLYSYKSALENELKEYLGINNVGVAEKKEHLISDEVDANNEAVAVSGDCFRDMLEEFTERARDVFGITLTLIDNTPEPVQEEDQDEEDEKEEKEDDPEN